MADSNCSTQNHSSLLIRSARLVYLFYRLNPNKEQGGPDMCAPHFMILALTLIIVPT